MSRRHAIKPCPNCGSSNVRHKDEDMHRMTHSAGHLGTHQAAHAVKGHPAGLLFVAGCWAAGKLVHSLSKPWSCQNCHHDYA